jgi:hypothetical protein
VQENGKRHVQGRSHRIRFTAAYIKMCPVTVRYILLVHVPTEGEVKSENRRQNQIVLPMERATTLEPNEPNAKPPSEQKTYRVPRLCT